MEKNTTYKDKINEQIQKLNAQFDKLMESADKAKEQVKAECQKQIKSLQDKQVVIGKKFGEFKKSSEDTFEDIKTATGKSLDALKKTLDNTTSGINKFVEKKDVYIKNIDAQFKQLDAQINKLSAMAGKAAADAKINYYKQIEVLKEKQKLVKNKLEEIKKSSANAWTDIKTGIDKSAQEFKKAITDAVSRFK